MVYHQKVVACVKVDGKVLRESGDSVSIPFGSEYSVLLKNLDSVRVMVKVSIDGKDATEGTWLVIPPNQSIELERFIRDGNLKSGNRFKFIQMTDKIEKHRGIEAEDGLIRVEWKREKVTQIQDHIIHRHHYHDWYWHRPYYVPYYPPYTFYSNVNDFKLGGTIETGTVTTNALNLNNVTLTSSAGLPDSQATFNAQNSSSPLRSRLTKSASPVRSMSAKQTFKMEGADAGITVPGSESNQKFESVGWFPTHDQSEAIVIKLRGAVAGKKVKKAVTVKTKPTCSTCGKKNRPTAKFCVDCGTSLSLI